MDEETSDPLTIYEKIRLAHALRTSVSMLMQMERSSQYYHGGCRNE